MVLPNLCRNSAILLIVLLSQLCVIVAWLFLPSFNDGITTLGIALLYSLLVALLGSSALCLSRAWIARQRLFVGVAGALMLMVLSLITIELLFQSIILPTEFAGFNFEQLARRSLAALIAAAVLLRLISLVELFNQYSRAEAESRVLALQSRIQPHFLFNSLNTISELASTSADKAEAAINSLATLFRASLENDQSFHSLDQEIKLCQRYLELERFRIQDKLVVEWHVLVDDCTRWRIPKLMLQPLVENALVHGMQESGQVFVKLDIRESRNHVSVMIENKMGECAPSVDGHGMAVKNIRQRLETLYDDKFTFRSKLSDHVYSVLLRIPKQAFIQASSHISTPGG